MTIKQKLILLSIVLFATLLRFYSLGSIPAGVYVDEASQGYNAYSLMLTGRDEWGKSFPIFLRSFGTYQSPLYTYLTIIPVKIFGLTIFATRFISAISGVGLVLITFLIIYKFVKQNSFEKATIASLLVAISPWSILNSRAAIESNLALFLVAVSIFLFLSSLKRPSFFILGAFILGLSAHAYHAERILGFMIIIVFTIIFRINLLKNKKYLFLGIIIFLLIQLPQFLLLNTPGALRRFDQQNYLNDNFFQQNGGQFKQIIFGKYLYFLNEFSSQYLTFFSPRSLFIDPDPIPERSIPQLSVFYVWMFIPLLFGVKIFKNLKEPFVKVLLMLTIVSSIPAVITRDPFYTLRALPLFWVLTLIISLGFYEILQYIYLNKFKQILSFSLIVWSLLSLYSCYFILLNSERVNVYKFQYQEFSKLSNSLKNKQIVLDSFPGRSGSNYILIAFYKKYDPLKMQQQTIYRVKDQYYTNTNFDGQYVFDNIEIRPIYWKRDIFKDQILVGDSLTFSDKQIKEYQLEQIFQIKDNLNNVLLAGYKTNPQNMCNNLKIKHLPLDPMCRYL